MSVEIQRAGPFYRVTVDLGNLGVWTRTTGTRPNAQKAGQTLKRQAQSAVKKTGGWFEPPPAWKRVNSRRRYKKKYQKRQKQYAAAVDNVYEHVAKRSYGPDWERAQDREDRAEQSVAAAQRKMREKSARKHFVRQMARDRKSSADPEGFDRRMAQYPRAIRRAYRRIKNPTIRVGEAYILPDGTRIIVQRVRPHDAYVRAPYGSTWMPLSNLRDARRVKKVYAKPQRGRKRRIRRRNPEYTPEQLAYLDRRATWVKSMNKRIRAALDLGHFTYTDAYVAGSRIFIRGMPESQRRRFKSYAKKAALGKVTVSGADNSTLVIDTKKRNPSRRRRRNPVELYSGLYKYTVAQKDLKVGSYVKALSTGETIKITKISGNKVTFSTPGGSVTTTKKVAADNLGHLMYQGTHYGKGVEVGNLRFKYGGKVMTS